MNPIDKANGNGFRMLPIEHLREAPYNPRKTFDDEQLKGLIESVKAKGVLMPLLVRQRASGNYEIMGGARRYRAAAKAGLATVPCRVLEVASDDEAIEIAIIDNLQRTDVSELEEADGFQAWLDRGHKPEELAAKIGKSIRHVYSRLGLLKLSEPVKKALAGGEIEASHAEVIGRLSKPESQAKALELAIATQHDARMRDTIVQPPKVKGKYGYMETPPKRGLVSVRALEEIVTALKVGEDLVAKVEEWRKDGRFKAALIGHNDRGYESKSILKRHQWKKQHPKRPCTHFAKGVLVDDGQAGKRGDVIDICRTESCGQHFPAERNSPAVSAEQRNRWEDERRRQEAREEREKKFRKAVFDAVAPKVPATLDRWVLALAVCAVDHRQRYSLDKALKMSDEEMVAAIVEPQLSEEADNGWGDARLLMWAAKQLGVDVEAIREECKRSQEPKPAGLIRWGDVKNGGCTGRGQSGLQYIVKCDKSTVRAKHGRYSVEAKTAGGGFHGGMSPFKTLEEAKARCEEDEKRMPKSVKGADAPLPRPKVPNLPAKPKGAKAKKPKRGEATTGELTARVANEYATHARAMKDGVTDPQYHDGTNIGLIRNHIIGAKRDLQKALYKESLEDVPAIFLRPLPPIVPDNFMAKDREVEGRVVKATKLARFGDPDEPECAICGCVERRACVGGCTWAELDEDRNVGLCSACEELGAEFPRRDKPEGDEATA